MSQSSPAIIDRPSERHPPRADAPTRATGRIALALYDDFAAVEQEWRSFERIADCTVFQAFDWLDTWYRHIGRRNNVSPAIVAGRRADGELMFLLPLAVLPGRVRRLVFLGC